MNLPWILGALGAMAFFAVFEARAFAHPERQNTLSRAIATLGAKWPFSIFLMGMIVGTLAAHFFWAWPTNPLAGGG
jgi:hypothetical protein